MDSKPSDTAAAAERVYEEFEPKMEWEREPGVDTLLIHLQDFKKEQLRVQITSSGMIRISGERPLSENRWSRFLKEIPISSIYNHNEISARYDKGILFVKQPKLIVPDADKLQEQEQPPVEASTLDRKPAQEKAQPPIQAPSKPEQKSSSAHEKVRPPSEVPKLQKTEGQAPSESAPKPQEQPQEKPTSDQQQPEKQKGGRIDGAANDSLSRKTPGKEKEPVKYELKKKRTDYGQAEAEAKGIATTSKSAKPENLDDSSLDSTKMDKGKAAKGLMGGADKLNMGSYKKSFDGLVMDMKKPRKLVNLVLIILSVVVLGIYGRKAISWCFKKSEN